MEDTIQRNRGWAQLVSRRNLRQTEGVSSAGALRSRHWIAGQFRAGRSLLRAGGLARSGDLWTGGPPLSGLSQAGAAKRKPGRNGGSPLNRAEGKGRIPGAPVVNGRSKTRLRQASPRERGYPERGTPGRHRRIGLSKGDSPSQNLQIPDARRNAGGGSLKGRAMKARAASQRARGPRHRSRSAGSRKVTHYRPIERPPPRTTAGKG
jgi:hypothetical protein